MRFDLWAAHRSAWCLFATVMVFTASCGEILGLEDGVTQGACTADDDCAPGYGCLLGTCRNGCTDDSQCGVGARCLKAIGTSACIPASEGCGRPASDGTSGGGCPAGTTCEANACRTPCNGTASCAERAAVSGRGVRERRYASRDRLRRSGDQRGRGPFRAGHRSTVRRGEAGGGGRERGGGGGAGGSGADASTTGQGGTGTNGGGAGGTAVRRNGRLRGRDHDSRCWRPANGQRSGRRASTGRLRTGGTALLWRRWFSGQLREGGRIVRCGGDVGSVQRDGSEGR